MEECVLTSLRWLVCSMLSSCVFFDIFHFGHANAIRQAAEFGDYLVAGVHSDEQIEQHKGPPVLTLQERCELVRGCRWVDEVVPDAPYVTQVDFVKRHNIDYVVHGDDVTTDSEGNDTYRLVKAAGMYKECKRTEGISTTDAISRVLTGGSSEPRAPLSDQQFRDLLLKFATDARHPRPQLCDASKVYDIPEGQYLLVRQEEKDGRPTTMIAGAFDGLVEDIRSFSMLHTANDCALMVLLRSDEAVLRGTGRPAIFSLQERALGVLQNKHVHGVVIPLTAEMSTVNTNKQPMGLYKRIEERREALEARQARKLGKTVHETRLKEGTKHD